MNKRDLEFIRSLLKALARKCNDNDVILFRNAQEGKQIIDLELDRIKANE